MTVDTRVVRHDRMLILGNRMWNVAYSFFILNQQQIFIYNKLISIQ